jgi:diadenylate cyclase
VGWRLLVDFAVLTTAIYVVLHWSRQARALRVTFGILVLEAGAWAAGRCWPRADVIRAVLHGAAIIAVVALIALFQPELRHAINRLEVTAGTSAHRNAALTGLEAIAAAIFSLAAAHRGALIVVQRRDSINELIQGGVPLGGQLSVEILEAIFRKVSPVHDGAARATNTSRCPMSRGAWRVTVMRALAISECVMPRARQLGDSRTSCQ